MINKPNTSRNTLYLLIRDEDTQNSPPVPSDLNIRRNPNPRLKTSTKKLRWIDTEGTDKIKEA